MTSISGVAALVRMSLVLFIVFPTLLQRKSRPPNTAFHKVSDHLLFLRHSKMRRVRAGSRLLNHFRRVMLMWIQKLSLMVSDPIHVTEM